MPPQNPKMDDVEYTKEAQKFVFEKLAFAIKRGCEIADEFNKLEVQIAAVLLAFTGLFISQFTSGLSDFSPTAAIGLKFLYASIVINIVLSLILGLVHLKAKENWWDRFLIEGTSRFDAWDEVLRGEKSLKEGLAFQRGIYGTRDKMVHSPLWTWVLQTIFLGIGGILLIVLFLIFIFK